MTLCQLCDSINGHTLSCPALGIDKDKIIDGTVLMTSYPVPHYAATIWLSGNDICLGFEETSSSPGHTARIPATEKGLKVALDILRARQALPSETGSQIGHRAEPTQFDLDAEMRKYQKRTKLDDDPEKALRELGLI